MTSNKGKTTAAETYINVIVSFTRKCHARKSKIIVIAMRQMETIFAESTPNITGTVFLPYAISPSKSSISLIISRIRFVRKEKRANPLIQYTTKFNFGGVVQFIV
jgi:hypothetical protein